MIGGDVCGYLLGRKVELRDVDYFRPQHKRD